jgi:hypothetical protein
VWRIPPGARDVNAIAEWRLQKVLSIAPSQKPLRSGET